MTHLAPEQLTELLDVAKALTLAAGGAILRVARGDVTVDRKADESPVTNADLASEEVILSGLRELPGDFPIVSEESQRDVVSGPDRTYWLVDPLDGTKEFVSGNGEFTVNIALVEGDTPILGTVGVPAQGVLYYAARGLGAWKDTGSDSPERLQGGVGDRPLTAVASRSHPSAETDAFMETVGIARVIRRGSSLKMCAVAEGAADVYPRLGPTCYWDTAAGTAVATEAGCCVDSVEGKPLRYAPGDGVLHAGFVVYNPEACLTSRIREALARVRG